MRPTTHTYTRSIRPIAIIALLVAASQTLAQTSQNLRQELDRSKTHVNELLIQVDQAQKKIESLTADHDRLTRQLAALQAQLNQSTPPDQPKARIPTDPFAAPTSMLAELRRRLARQMHRYPLETDQQIAAYQRNVEKWCTTIPRSLRGKTTWLVRIEILNQENPRPNQKKASIQILDESLARIGDPFRVPIPNRFADRIERAIDNDLWELTAFVTAQPRLDPNRPDPGIFNAPDFIGPYAQFDFAMDWVGLAPTTRTKATRTTTPTNKSNFPDRR